MIEIKENLANLYLSKFRMKSKNVNRWMEKQTSEANPNLNFNQITDMLNVGFALTLCHKYQLFGAMKIKGH